MKLISIFIIVVLLSSCIKEQPKVAWLKIDKWELVPNSNAKNPQGELTHNFSQAFVNMNGKFLGVYELPAKIPIIAEDGEHEFVIMPGIKNNGFSDEKKRYPHVEQFKGTILLTMNDTTFLTPTTKYFANLNFLIEDFESPSMQLDVANESSAKLGRNDLPDILKWGNKYGEILLNNNDSLLSFMTTFGKSLPKFGTEVYLEFDYMNTNSCLISTITYGNGDYFEDPYVALVPQEEEKAVWKHAYIDLKENISYRQNTPMNEVQLQFMLDEKNAERYFYIDNIKIIYP